MPAPTHDMSDTIDLATLSNAARQWEVFTEVRAVWPEWQRCQHGKRCAVVRAHWSDDAPFLTTVGQVNSTQTYTRTVHIDGTYETKPDGSMVLFEHGVHNRCPECGTIDSLTTAQLAWGDETTCRTDGCAYNRYYSIGD